MYLFPCLIQKLDPELLGKVDNISLKIEENMIDINRESGVFLCSQIILQRERSFTKFLSNALDVPSMCSTLRLLSRMKWSLKSHDLVGKQIWEHALTP